MSKDGMPFQASLSLSSSGILHTAGVDAQGLRHTRAVGRICLGEVRDLPLLNEARHSLHGTGDVCDEACLGRGVHQAELIAGLGVVVVARTMVVAIGVAADALGCFAITCIVRRSAEAVRLINGTGAAVAIEAGLPVAVIVMH